MNVEIMRQKISEAPRYKYSLRWREKVNKMPDNQVMAIYFRFMREGLIND